MKRYFYEWSYVLGVYLVRDRQRGHLFRMAICEDRDDAKMVTDALNAADAVASVK